MKKINLLTDEVSLRHSSLIDALNKNVKFGISVDGEIDYEPFNSDKVYIYQGISKPNALLSSLNILQGDYKLRQDGENIYINAGKEWQNILELNRKNALYEDVSADGIDVFKDEELENIGWHATEFNISYRDIVEELEEKLDGAYLVYIEVEEPYRFSGFCTVTDIDSARSIAFNYVKNRIIDKLENDADFAKNLLTADEKRAAEYFGIDI